MLYFNTQHSFIQEDTSDTPRQRKKRKPKDERLSVLYITQKIGISC